MGDAVDWDGPAEGLSFDDSDHFEEDSLCSWMSEPESLCRNWRGWQTQLSGCGNVSELCFDKAGDAKEGNVPSLIELSAQTVALQLPFEQVERFPIPIPENLQLRIAFWSFPESVDDIRLYSCLANGNADEFQKGEHLMKSNCIVDVMQIGFHLSATVQLPPTTINKGSCLVAVTFDRQRITSCACNCESSAKWCSHVVALCLARILQPDTVCLRAPVSESLSRLQRDQLQKFAQYLISELPQQILPTAQRLLDELLASSSTAINEEAGAPDPTAGPSLSDISIWCLDEQALIDNIKKTLVKFCGPSPIVYSDVNSLYLSSTEPPAASEYSSLLRPLRGREPEGIWNLLSIVREMLRRRDCNAVLLLDIVTEQCLSFEQIAIWWYNTCTSVAHLHNGTGQQSAHRPANNINSEIAQHAAASLCDEIVSLWRLVLLSPPLQKSRKKELKQRLSNWDEKTLNIIKRGKYKENHLRLFPGFKEAITTCDFEWNGGSCINICRHIICTCGNSTTLRSESASPVATHPVKKYFMTKNDQESIMTAYRQELDYLFSRAESLYVHGYITKASEMAVKLAKEILNNPENLVAETSPERAKKADWIKSCTEYAYKTFERILFLCNVLSGNQEHRLLAFQVGLYGLQFERLPASSKAMEVKLFHKQLQITTVMKKLPLAEQEVAILRVKAKCLIDYGQNGNSFSSSASGNNYSCVQHVLPLHLAMFVFDALCQPIGKPTNDKEKKTNNHSRWEYRGDGDVTKDDQELGFLASVTALGYKVNVSEAEHPLLCEGTRRQKGDLAVMLLVQFKNSHSKIKMILDKLLDKTLAPNLNAKSAFTVDSVTNSNSYGSTYAYRKNNMSTSSNCVPRSAAPKSPSTQLPKPADTVVIPEPDSKFCTACKTSIVHQMGPQAVLDSNSSTHADDSSEEEDSNARHSEETDAMMASVLSKQMRVDSGNEDVKSSSCDEEYPIHICSPQRRDGKASWRSPTVRPKRRQQCITNVNSSASEEAMLSDTSPRLTRKVMSSLPSTSAGNQNGLGNNKTPTSSSAWISRYPASPSSDSSSNHSMKSDDFDANGVSNNLNASSSSTPPSSQSAAQQSAVTSSGGKTRSGNNFRMKNRGRNATCVPDIPNQPSEATAHFFFELAKTVLVKAGGNSSTSLFMQPRNSSQSGVNRNLLLAAFEIGLYALGMHNCVSPNWLSRTYSSHVSWISGQAMEIGSASLQILVDSWEGHLTPTETVSLADRASHGRDPTTVQVAAELALSVLPHAHAVNPNEVCRALYQCRDQGPEMLEKASIAVEHAGRSGGVHPDVLFAVAKQWQWLHQNEIQGQRNNSPHQAVPVSIANVANIPQQSYAVPIAAGAPNVAGSVAGMMLHPTNVVTFQSESAVHPHQPVGIAVHPSTIPQPVTLIPQAAPRAPLLHPSAGFATTPIVSQSPVPPHSQLAVLDTQYSSTGGTGHHIVTPHLLPSATALPHSHHAYASTPIHHHAGGINLIPMQHSNRIHLQYCAASGAFLAEPLSHTHQHHGGHQSLPLTTAISPITAGTLPIQNHAASYRLQSAFRVGMLAMELLAKRTEERPNSKYAKNPPYTQNVKWLLKLSLELGGHCVQQFCLATVTAIHTPFLLQDIAVETAQYLAMNNHQQACSNLRLPFLQPILQKCMQMYIHLIHNRLYHLHHSDYDEFATLVHNSKTAFLMTPGGLVQFNEVIQSIRRSKSCKKELWQKIVAGLAMSPTTA